MHHDTDESEGVLVERAKRGDMEACEKLILRNQDQIFNSIAYMTADRDLAADLTQSVFLKAIENINSFKGASQFSTWLYSIMLNTVRSFRRKQISRKTMSLDIDHSETGKKTIQETLEAAGENPGDALESKEKMEMVTEAIQSLKKEFRDIIVLRDIEGLSYKELEKILGISSGTVKSRLSRARYALKEVLEPYF